MNDSAFMALALDPTLILTAQHITPDPWQRELLFATADHILLNCSRGAGKSRTTSALALHTALFQPSALVLLISRSQRQSGELFRYVKQGFRAINGPGFPIKAIKETETQLEFENNSRVVCLPGQEETIRAYQGVNLLVLDEAARIPDDLYASVSPMTSVSKGRTVCLSTPFGQRGWWYSEWHDARAKWQRFKVPWSQCPRLTRDVIDEERRKFGDNWIAQEYECSFTAMEGLVYPNFHDQVRGPGLSLEVLSTPGLRLVGGIDFGFRNPFAAVWGVLRDDVLFIEHEIYVRATPLSSIVERLPRNVEWAADPAGAEEIRALKLANYKVFKANNAIRAGLAAVTARLQLKRLRVNEQRCPNLLQEARLYRYPSESERTDSGENPIDSNNHALAALRYLISRIDAAYMARMCRAEKLKDSPSDDGPPRPKGRPLSDFNDPDLWTTL